MWWLAPAMLWLGVTVAAVGGVMAWASMDFVPAAVTYYLPSKALVIVFTGIAFILAGIGLYLRNSSCCGDGDWEEHPTNTAAPHIH